jgi:predicted RNase H-like HicB family nuclease
VKTISFTYWQDGGAWLGYVDEFPNYMTQGDSLEDLQEHLSSLYQDLTSGEIPSIRRRGELKLAA